MKKLLKMEIITKIIKMTKKINKNLLNINLLKAVQKVMKIQNQIKVLLINSKNHNLSNKVQKQHQLLRQAGKIYKMH